MVNLTAKIDQMKVKIDVASKVSLGTTKRPVAATPRVSGHALMATVSLTLNTVMANLNAPTAPTKATSNVASENSLSTTPKSVAATLRPSTPVPMVNAS